jgi:hypothetical protein
MASTAVTHVLDTSVFTQANRLYYPFDVCPGFWDCLLHHGHSNRLVSIDRVHNEIRAGNDELKAWAAKPALRAFFAPTSEPAVVARFGEMMQWAQAQPQFMPAAKAEFAKVADGWVVAYAKAHGLTVVAQEEYAGEARKRVPLPNVCRAFDVPSVNTYDMLRALGIRFIWMPPARST